MSNINKGEPATLLLGDVVILYISLWLMLFFRYFDIPHKEVFFDHVLPFSILFLVWLIVFFIAGLYERHTSMMRRSLPNVLLKTQVSNSILAVLFFYFIPYFGITPKTNLFIYLIFSLILLFIWRTLVFTYLIPRTKYQAMLIGRGEEMKELRDEINNTAYYGYQIQHSVNLDNIETLDVQEDIVKEIYEKDISIIIIDTQDDAVVPLLPHFYNLMFSNINFIDMHEVYEQIFGRVPLSLVKHGWFLENVRSKPHVMYDALKRIMDIMIAFILAIFSLVFYPFVFIAQKIEDRGPMFITQERIGKNNQVSNIIKFRTMSFNDNGNYDDDLAYKNQVTKVGSFLRKTRIDEFPQLWNVVLGDLSLIGPRPELQDLVKKYSAEIPYYNVRHLIKPGLSGWAQMKHDNHPHHGTDVVETRNKLSFDLYYIKNRSFLLDLKIALQTIKLLLSQKGR